MIVAVIPCLDEEENVGLVVEGFAPHVDHVVVVDNGSQDATSEVARAAGAEVVVERRRGYGRACRTGIEAALAHGPDIVLFLDGDGSDDPIDAPRVLEPVQRGEVQLCLGRRVSHLMDPDAMEPVQRFGNWLAPFLMRRLLGAPYHDMPPFKAIQADALAQLDLRDETYGFTIEMLIKAHRRGLTLREVDVHHRARHGGQSKVSGTLVGSAKASVKILSTIARHAYAEARG